MKKLLVPIAVVALAGSAFAAGKVSLTGAGSTFAYPLYSKWFAEYNELHPEIEVNYQSIGSGGGINQVSAKTVDFGGTDAPLTDEQWKKAPDLIHIPTMLGAVVVSYNVPEIKDTLHIGPQTLADIYLGKIKRWDDEAIAKDNPGMKLPKTPIAVVHRADGSGTSAVFTDYLSHVSPEWKSKVGSATSVNWPVGLGGKGNEGVSGQVRRVKGAIGYLELAYALQNEMPTAQMKNKEGEWITATPHATSLAAAGAAANMPEDLRVSIVDAPGKGTYPIAAFSWALVYKNQADAVKGKALVDLLWWGIHDGQKYSESLSYAPLPEQVVKMDEAKLRSVVHDGKPLLAGS